MQFFTVHVSTKWNKSGRGWWSFSLTGFHGAWSGQLARWHSQSYTASLFLRRGKQQRPQPVTPQACCDIWHWNSAPLSAGALDRRTTHQNSPLHLCLEVSVRESSKRDCERFVLYASWTARGIRRGRPLRIGLVVKTIAAPLRWMGLHCEKSHLC